MPRRVAPEPTATESTTPQTPSVDAAASKLETVTLEIYKPESDGSATPTEPAAADFTQSFDVEAGTTLEQVMRKMDQPKMVITGSGVTAFVQSIDGMATDSSRGWTFTVDDEFANVGIGSLELTPPQTIRWRFTTLEEATK